MPDSRLPDGWRRLPLRDVATIVMGQAPPGSTVADWNGGTPNEGLPFIQGNAEFTNSHPIPAKWCSEPAKVAEAGDTLISVRAPVGEMNLADRKLAIGRGVAALRFTGVDVRFGWHQVALARVSFSRIAQGSTFTAINSGDLANLELLAPPPDEQRRIAEILDTIDATIEKTEAVIATTERLRSALLGELLTRGVPGWHTVWKDVPGIGTIPACWDVVRLGDLLTSSVYGPRFPGTLYSDEGNVATLRTTDLDDGGTICLEGMPRAQLPIDDFLEFFLADNDVVITRSGSCGIAAVFQGHSMPVLPGAFLIRLRPKRSEYSTHLKLWLNSESGRSATKRIEAGGVQKNLNAQNLRQLQLPWPRGAERAAIVAVAQGILERTQREQTFLADARKAKVSVANVLLSGRVRTMRV